MEDLVYWQNDQDDTPEDEHVDRERNDNRRYGVAVGHSLFKENKVDGREEPASNCENFSRNHENQRSLKESNLV